MTNGKSSTDWISRQQARKLRVDEALQELERAQKAMTDSERRRTSGVDTDMLYGVIPIGGEKKC